jgi:hypothetical protein
MFLENKNSSLRNTENIFLGLACSLLIKELQSVVASPAEQDRIPKIDMAAGVVFKPLLKKHHGKQ